MRRRDYILKGRIFTDEPISLEYVREQLTSQWEVSARDPKGRLLLVDHPHEKDLTRLIVRSHVGEYPYNWNGQATSPTVLTNAYEGRKEAYNEAYNRLRGKLYKGNSALGVTLGSYKQSKEMVNSRLRLLNGKADEVLAKLSTSRVTAKKAAGVHLEIIFGWMPLVAEVVAVTETLCQQAFPPAYVVGRGKYLNRSVYVEKLPQNTTHTHRVETQGRVTLSATIQISNPNLWLAERAGALNPASVAWDLVPWSFVVNMFVNTGTLVNSLTDFAGLSFLSCSRTYNDKVWDDSTVRRLPSYWYPTVSNIEYTQLSYLKSRTLHALPPRPNLVFRLPGLSVFNLAMGASLLTQKVGAITRLINPFLK